VRSDEAQAAVISVSCGRKQAGGDACNQV